MRNVFLLGVAAAGLLAALPVAAQSHRYTTVYGAPAAYGGYWYDPAVSADELNQRENNYSGTLGRQGLGADPRHPEGPGNAVSPR